MEVVAMGDNSTNEEVNVVKKTQTDQIFLALVRPRMSDQRLQLVFVSERSDREGEKEGSFLNSVDGGLLQVANSI